VWSVGVVLGPPCFDDLAASSDAWKFLLDLVILHHALLRDDLFQKQMQRRNVPLTIAQRAKQLALRIAATDLECLIERAARREHAEVLVERQERFPNGIDDRLRELACFLDLREQFIVGHCVSNGPRRG
jgi:hypothetical protein